MATRNSAGFGTPLVDVPIAVLRGDGNLGPGFCTTSVGTTAPFDEATLAASLYSSHASYVTKFNKATDEAVKRGSPRPSEQPQSGRRCVEHPSRQLRRACGVTEARDLFRSGQVRGETAIRDRDAIRSPRLRASTGTVTSGFGSAIAEGMTEDDSYGSPNSPAARFPSSRLRWARSPRLASQWPSPLFTPSTCLAAVRSLTEGAEALLDVVQRS